MTESPYLSEYQAGYIHKPGAKGVVQVERKQAPCPFDGCTDPTHARQQIPLEETRVVDPETGGMKGQKLARFSSIPSDVLWELAEHFGRGEAKYPNDPETGQPNWQKGYDWRLNVDALNRHLHLWLQGEDTDPETGSNHLVAVIWHATVLRWFQIHSKGKDFR